MRALVFHQFGEPKVLSFEERAVAEPRQGEVLIAVKAAAINPSDVKNVAGTMHGTTLPRVPGRDFSGVVLRGDADLVGQEVWGTGGDVGFVRDGSHAEMLLLPRTAVAIKPAAMSIQAAGAAGITFVTAWSALVTAAGIRGGDTALIIGAAGGVGSAAVQIARAHGARVIGGVRNDRDGDTARRLGAHDVVNTAAGKLGDEVRKISGAGASVILDTSGRMFPDAIDAAATGGRVAIITAPPDGMATFNLRAVYRKTLTLHGIDTMQLTAEACAKLLTDMAAYFEGGQFKAETAEAFPLADGVQAYQRAAKGGGRVYLRP